VQGGKILTLSAPEGWWTLLYVLEGTLTVNDQPIEAHYLLVFSKEGTTINVSTLTSCKLLYLSGEPIEEPVAAKGNIVMNTAAEVEQAEKDIAAGAFGSLDFKVKLLGEAASRVIESLGQ
jgi:quercetin 2,3-dioxygenase